MGGVFTEVSKIVVAITGVIIGGATHTEVSTIEVHVGMVDKTDEVELTEENGKLTVQADVATGKIVEVDAIDVAMANEDIATQ